MMMALIAAGLKAGIGVFRAWMRGWTIDHLIRRSGQVVQDRPSPVVGWADIAKVVHVRRALSSGLATVAATVAAERR